MNANVIYPWDLISLICYRSAIKSALPDFIYWRKIIMDTQLSPLPTHVPIIHVLFSNLRTSFEAHVLLELSTHYDIRFIEPFCGTLSRYSEVNRNNSKLLY